MKTADYHQEDEWRKAHKAWRLVDKYTGHKSAQPFKAHEKDVEMFELDLVSQKDKVKTEKILKEHQGLHGGMGANVTGIMVACEDMDKTLRDTWKFFKEGVHEDGAPIDYKKETLQFITDLHASVDKEFAGELKKLVQMAAKGFNSALEERRTIYINSARSAKMAKERLGKLQPADAKLFGGKAGELSKAMKDEGELRGRGKFEVNKPSGHYSSQYGGGRGVFWEADKESKPRRAAG